MSKKKLGSDQEFIGSLAYDVRLADYDIKGSIAHVTMLGKTKIINVDEMKRIIKGLESIGKDMKKKWSLPIDEDIHFAIEQELIRRIGKAGKKMHTGRSRNDQVVTDLYLYLRDQTARTVAAIKQFQKSLIKVAEKNAKAIMPGFTHLQHAQPILFAHHILAYAWMLERDKQRFEDLTKRLDILPLGSAALAGTSYPLDRTLTARLLKFTTVSENSLDATASRDVAVEFLSHASILMANISRFCEELILWSSSEFSYVTIGDHFTSGSSIMPQKKNPDVAELVRGKTGRVFGSLMALLTILKGTPLAYNRDLQEDKPPLFDGADTLLGCLSIMAAMTGSLKVHSDQMRRACDQGYLEATELADYLAKKGVPFRAAHEAVRSLVAYCQKRKLKFRQVPLKTLKKYNTKFDVDVLSILTPDAVVRAKSSYGGTSPLNVSRQIRKIKTLVK